MEIIEKCLHLQKFIKSSPHKTLSKANDYNFAIFPMFIYLSRERENFLLTFRFLKFYGILSFGKIKEEDTSECLEGINNENQRSIMGGSS